MQVNPAFSILSRNLENKRPYLVLRRINPRVNIFILRENMQIPLLLVSM